MSTEDLNTTNVIVQTEGEQYGEQIHTQISNSDLTNGIISVWNIDYQGRPTSWRIHNERQQISSTHFTIQLIQIPDDTQNMTIYVEDPITGDYRELYQVYNYDELIKPDTYYVHYANGIVKFNQELSGLNIVASYYGRGVMYISDSRIFHNKAGSVVDTLDNILNRAEDGLKLVEQSGGLANALNEIENKTEQGKIVIEQIEDTINSAQMFGCMVDFTKQSFVLKAEKDVDGNFRVTSKEMASVFAQLVAYKGGEPMVGIEIVTEDANDVDADGNQNIYQDNCSISFKNNVLSLNSITDPILGRAMARVRIDIPKSQLYVQGDASGVLSIYKDFEFAIMMDGEDLYNLELSTPIYAFRGNYDGFINETQEIEIDFTLTKANTTVDITELTYQTSSNSKLVIEKISNSKVKITALKDIDKESPTVPSNGLIVFNASGGGSSVTKNFVYSVIKEGKASKMLFLTGEQAFTYNNPNCTGYPNKTLLELKAIIQNFIGQVSINWYFLNSNGSPVELANGVNATISSDRLSCSIQCWDFNEEGSPIPNQDLNPWQGRRSVTIRAVADADTYDEITLYKIGTGQNGEDSFNVILSNETTSLTLDNSMNIVDNISNIYTDILCYKGSTKLDPSNVLFNVVELHECTIKYNNVFIAENGEARIQLSDIIEDPEEVEGSSLCLSLEDDDCFEFEDAEEDNQYDDNHTDDIEVETVTKNTVVSNDTSYVDIDVTYGDVTIRKRFTISKCIQGANGEMGDKGDTLVLDVTGGTRTITYAQVNTKPRPETSATFYAKLFNNGVEVDNNLVAYTWKANGHMTGGGYGTYFTPTILPTMDESIKTNEVILEATYKTTAKINGSVQTVYQTLHYYVPIVVTRDATGLDWVNEWEGTKTEIKDHAVFTPKIFAGTKDEQDRITGVAMGCDFINDGASVGLAGYQEDEVSFLLDTDGSLMVGNPFKDDGIGMYYSEGKLTINVTDMSISGSSVPTVSDVNSAVTEEVGKVRDEITSDFNDLQQQVNNIEESVNASIEDGVLNIEEKAKVSAILESLRVEYETVCSQVDKLLTNQHLTNEVVINNLSEAKITYSSNFTKLETTISNILNVSSELIPAELISAFNTSLREFEDASQSMKQVIDEAIININQQYSEEVITNAKNEIQGEVDDLTGALDNLENIMNGEFKSGLISQAKIKALLQHVQIINDELEDITAQFDGLIASTNLSNAKKTKLTELKGALDTANATLQASIESSIPDYLFTEEEITKIKNNITSYNDALKAYNVYAQECNVDIALNIAQGTIDAISDEEIFNKVTNQGIKQGLFIQDGSLFINGQYIQTYGFKAIRKTDGATTFSIDSNGDVSITPKSFTITTNTTTNIATKEYVDASISETVNYNVMLDNENQTIPVDADNYPLLTKSYRVGAYVYKNGKQITDFTIGEVKSAKGITVTVYSNYLVFSVLANTQLTSSSGEFYIPVIIDGKTFTKVFSWSIASQGKGADGRICSIASTGQAFTSKDGINYTPDTITLIPLLQNVTFDGWQYKYNDKFLAVADGDNGLSIEENNLIISKDSKLLDKTNSLVIKLTTTDEDMYDVISIVKLSNGQSLTVLLTNESQSFITDNNRMITMNQTYTTDIIVYRGSTEYEFTNGFTNTETDGINAKKVTDSQVSFTVTEGTVLPTDSGSFIIPIVVDGVTYNKVFSWSCAKTGEKGDSAISLDLSATTQVIRSNDGGESFSPSKITITANCQNTSASTWWISIDGGNNFSLLENDNASTLDVGLDTFTENNVDTLVVKCVSLTESVFDIITLQKIIDVRDIKVGNRNLALNTSDTWETHDTFSNISNECIFPHTVLIRDIEEGDTLSLFCKIKYKNIVMGESGSSTPTIRWQGSGDSTGWTSGTFGTASVSITPNQVGEIETYISSTFKVTSSHLENTLWETNWRVDYIESGEISIACMMVVNGKLPTGWIPAPEDMPSLIDNTVSSMLERNNEIMNEIYTITKDDYITPSERENLKMLYKQITAQYTTIVQTVEKMSDSNLNVNLTELDTVYTSLAELCVTTLDGNLTTGAIDLRNSMVEFYNVYNNTLFAISSYTKDELTRVSATLQQHEDSIELSVKRTDPDYESTLELGKHMKFSDGWLELYATINGEEGQFKTVLSNEKLAFMDSGEEVASISNQSLNINKAEIKNQLTVGNVVISPSANGGIVFAYITEEKE